MKVLNWLKEHNIYSLGFYKSKARIKRWLAIFFTSFAAVFILLSVSVLIIANVYLGKINRNDLDKESLGISEEAESLYDDKGVVNIMLFGVDSRSMSEESRSDAMIILTIDKTNKKIKMTSIARDTYVPIEGYGNDKLTHAFVYGWHNESDITGGAALALKTVNNAFNLNITDYVAANFWGLATIIDFVGGVDIDVDSSEMYNINTKYIPYMQQIGINCDYVSGTGVQHLTGGQAGAYCRLRFDSDVMRGERQREVLMAMYDNIKTLSVSKYPELVSLILKECSTSLSNSELTSLGMWAVANMGSIQFETLGLPTDDLNAYGQMVNGVWYYMYDLDAAAKKIEGFILETPAQ